MGIITGAKPVSSPSDDTHTGNLLPVQLALQTFRARFNKKDSRPGMRHLPSPTSASRTNAPRIAARPCWESAFGALVSFIEVPQSIEVPLRRNLQLFELIISSFQNILKNQHAKLHERHCRSLPLEARSSEQASNDHAHPRPRGNITDQPVMDIVDVGFYPSALSSSLMRSVPSERWNELATALQQSRLPFSFENSSSY